MEMQENLPVYDLYISENEESGVEVDAVALVDRPAIERNFLAFRAEEFVEPQSGESESEFIGRCMSVLVGDEGYEQEQAAAICYTKWRQKLSENLGGEGSGCSGPNCGRPETVDDEYVINTSKNYINDLGLDNNDIKIKTGNLPNKLQGYVEWKAGTDGKYYMSENVLIDKSVPKNRAEKIIAHELRHIYQSKNMGFFVTKEGIHWDGKLHIDTKSYKKIQSDIAKAKTKDQFIAAVKKYKSLPWEKDADDFAGIVEEFIAGIKKTDYPVDNIQLPDTFHADFQESITDIPDDVRANARNAVEWAEKNGWGSCGTQVGKTRASQLAKAGGAVSLDTVRRMYSYLSRHAGDLDSSKGYADGCGKLMYDAWGGKAGLRWARNVLRNELRATFAIEDEERRIISGPLILADTPIYRRDDNGEYYVKFPKKTIENILIKFAKKGYHTRVNLMHDSGQVASGVTIFEIFLTDRKRGIMPMKGFEDVPDGSAFASAKVENDEVWKEVKAGNLRGFSVEGIFNYALKPETKDEEMMSKIVDILRQVGKE